jgi:hypothetical protein
MINSATLHVGPEWMFQKPVPRPPNRKGPLVFLLSLLTVLCPSGGLAWCMFFRLVRKSHVSICPQRGPQDSFYRAIMYRTVLFEGSQAMADVVSRELGRRQKHSHHHSKKNVAICLRRYVLSLSQYKRYFRCRARELRRIREI